MDWSKLPDSFKQHLEHPNDGGSFEQYSATKHLSLGREIMSRKRVYLDTKYWVRFRNVLLGQEKCAEDKKLLDLIMDFCDSKSAICPCSYSCIEELLFQESSQSRSVTAELMDRLGFGVCLQPPHILLAIELDHWLHEVFLPETSLHDRENLVWTKIAYFVGLPRLKSEVLSTDQILAFEKSGLDALWELKVSQLSGNWGKHSASSRSEREANANDLSKGKFDHHDVSKTFDQLYADEVWGGLDVLQNQISPVFERLMVRTGYKGQPSEVEIKTLSHLIRKVITVAAKNRKLSTQLPQCHINASLHAALRMDPARKYKAGDCEDFRHAGSALPYCDVFLTEQSLCHLICTTPLHLDKEYGTVVAANPDEAIRAIESIAA